eukprot:3795975-Amphidinium_carterae.1
MDKGRYTGVQFLFFEPRNAKNRSVTKNDRKEMLQSRSFLVKLFCAIPRVEQTAQKDGTCSAVQMVVSASAATLFQNYNSVTAAVGTLANRKHIFGHGTKHKDTAQNRNHTVATESDYATTFPDQYLT